MIRTDMVWSADMAKSGPLFHTDTNSHTKLLKIEIQMPVIFYVFYKTNDLTKRTHTCIYQLIERNTWNIWLIAKPHFLIIHALSFIRDIFFNYKMHNTSSIIIHAFDVYFSVSKFVWSSNGRFMNVQTTVSFNIFRNHDDFGAITKKSKNPPTFLLCKANSSYETKRLLWKKGRFKI